MRTNGNADRFLQTPNGGFNFQLLPLLQGPSPAAVSFLQKELGQLPGQPPPTVPLAAPPERFSDIEMSVLQPPQGPQPQTEGSRHKDPENDLHDQALLALADLFTCPESSFPISVGIFQDSGTHPTAPVQKHYTLDKLEAHLEKLVEQNTRLLSRFSPAIIVPPALAIFTVAFLLCIVTKYEVGISIGLVGLYLQVLVIVAIPVGKSFFNLHLAGNISRIFSNFGRQVKLLTKFTFFYPQRQCSSSSPVNIQTVYYRLSTSPNTPHLSLMLLQGMWSAMDKNYNPLVVRLQRFMHNSMYPISVKRNYKRICCLPAYIVVILLSIALFIDLLLLRIFSFDAIKMLRNVWVLPVFVIMSSIIFLAVCASVPSIFNAIFTLIYRPKTALQKAIEDYATVGATISGSKQKAGILQTITSRHNNSAALPLNSNGISLPSLEAATVLPVTSSCEVDILAKNEFATLCDMLQAFNFYLDDMEHTRMVVLIDASEAATPVQLAGVLYQVHSLMLTQPNAPVAFVIATDIKVFLGKQEPPRTVSNRKTSDTSMEATGALNLLRGVADSNHLVLFNIHLPIFLDVHETASSAETFENLPGALCLQTHLQRASSQMAQPQSAGNIWSAGNRKISSSSKKIGFMFDEDELPLSVRSKSSIAGQVNKAYTSAEELGMPHSGWNSLKPAQSITSMVDNIPVPAKTDTTEAALLTTVNSSRLQATKAGAKGIAEIFLSNEDTAAQNVSVIRTLVAETAFTSRFLKLTSSTVAIRQLANWIYMTQHWPYHTAWLIAMLEDEEEEEAIVDDISSSTTLLSEFITKALDEIASLPPFVSILSGDDRDPEKLLRFSQNQSDCTYSVSDLKSLAQNSLFVNPFVKTCIKGIRQCHFGKGKLHHLPGVPHDLSSDSISTARRDTKAPTQHSLFRVGGAPVPAPLQLPLSAESDYARSRGLSQQHNDSSGDAKSPLPVSIDSDVVEKNLCFANPANVSVVEPCPIRLRSNIPMAALSKMSVEDICTLLSAISDIPPGNCAAYQLQIRRQNISGQVLAVCDLAKLRSELQMSFGDWQLFSTCIIYLRGLETHLKESYGSRRGLVAETKSSSGSVGLSPSVLFPQIIVPQSQFVFSNGQHHCYSKNTFDVPVRVEKASCEATRHCSRQNADRTTSDFSFGSGTDEMELIWHRDAMRNSMKGPHNPPSSDAFRQAQSGSSKGTPSRSSHAWPHAASHPVGSGLSKSSYDLRPTHRGATGNSHSINSGARRSNGRTKQKISAVKLPFIQPSPSATSEQMVSMFPAYMPKGSDVNGFIPLWYPTLSGVGEVKQTTPHQSQKGNSCASSSASGDGTYDFPSEYSSCEFEPAYSTRQCAASCPHNHYNRRRRRRKASRSRKSPGRGQSGGSSRRSSAGRCSQRSADGCTCDRALHTESRSTRRDGISNPWTPRSPRKMSSPDLSEIEAMTSS